MSLEVRLCLDDSTTFVSTRELVLAGIGGHGHLARKWVGAGGRKKEIKEERREAKTKQRREYRKQNRGIGVWMFAYIVIEARQALLDRPLAATATKARLPLQDAAR